MISITLKIESRALTWADMVFAAAPCVLDSCSCKGLLMARPVEIGSAREHGRAKRWEFMGRVQPDVMCRRRSGKRAYVSGAGRGPH